MAQDDYSADIAELVQLKGLATRPNVVHELERLIEAYQGKQNNSLRQPMQISKAKAQTVYITSSYAWGQSEDFVIIYLNIKNASRITSEQYTLSVQPLSVRLDIRDHEGANYVFTITHLHSQVVPEKSKIKIKETKVLIYLCKETPGKSWADLRLKSTRHLYDELQRGKELDYRLTISQELLESAAAAAATATTSSMAKSWRDKLDPFAMPGSSEKE